MMMSRSPEGSKGEEVRSLGGAAPDSSSVILAPAPNPRSSSKISTFRGPNPSQLTVNQQTSMGQPHSQIMPQVDKSQRKQTLDRERYDGSGGGKMTQAAASTIVAMSGLTANHEGKRQTQKRKFRSNNPNLKTQENQSPPKIYLKKENGNNPQPQAVGGNNYDNKSIQIDHQGAPNGFFSNVSTNQTLAGMVKIDSHRLSKLNNNRNLKSSMVLVTKETIQTNKMTKLQSSRAAFTMGKSNLDHKMNKQQSCGPKAGQHNRPKIRDYSPIGEISNARATYLNLKPRLAVNQFDRGKECDETSNFSNLTVPKQKTDQKEKKQTNQNHGKKQSYQVEKRNGKSIVLQDSAKLKQKSFDHQIQIGSGQIYKNQSYNELSIPVIEANSRLSIQQIAAKNNIEILNQQYVNGLQSSKKLEDKLCTISSSAGQQVEGTLMTGRASDFDDISSQMALHTHASAIGSQGRGTGFAPSIAEERNQTQIENDGDDEPSEELRFLTDISLQNKQNLPSLQSITIQQPTLVNGSVMNNNLLPIAPSSSKALPANHNKQTKINQKSTLKHGVTDSPLKNSKGFQPLTSMNKSAIGSGGTTTMISMNMSEKNNFTTMKTSMQDTGHHHSKFLKKKGEGSEAVYSKNGFCNAQQQHHSAYHSQISKSNSLNQRFSANFATSSDVYGAAHRSKHKGGVNDSASRYFGKSKFSMNSQQGTKNINSVLSQIKEGVGNQADFTALSSQQLDSFERKYSLSSLRGQKSLESKILKHQNIQIIDRNQKQIKMKSKRFLNNSVHQKVSGMQMSLPVSKLGSNQDTIGLNKQDAFRDGALRNQNDSVHHSFNQQLSRYHHNPQLGHEARSKSNVEHTHKDNNSKQLSITTSENGGSQPKTKTHTNSAFLDDTVTNPLHQAQEVNKAIVNDQRSTFYPMSHSHLDPKIFAQVLASSSQKNSPPLVKNTLATSNTETMATNPTTTSNQNLILASSNQPECILEEVGKQQKQLFGPTRSMALLSTSNQDIGKGVQMPVIQNSAKGGISQLQMALQQNVQRKSIHGKKKRNVPVQEILDSLKLGNNENGYNRATDGQAQLRFKNRNVKDFKSGDRSLGLDVQAIINSQTQDQQKRISDRSSLQPQSRIQDNDNVLINSSRVNKTQKKSKLNIQDPPDLESFRAGERYKEKHNGSNSQKNGWKKQSVSVKNYRKTLVVCRNKIDNNMGVASNTNLSQGSTNREKGTNYSSNFPQKKVGAVEQQSLGANEQSLKTNNSNNLVNGQVKVKLQYQNSSPMIVSQTSFNKNSSIGQKLDTINELRAPQLSPEKIDQLEDEASSQNNNGLNEDPSVVNRAQEVFDLSTNRRGEEDEFATNQEFVFNDFPEAKSGPGLTQTIQILDNNLQHAQHQKTQDNTKSGVPLLNHQVFNEYQDFSGLNKDYLDITGGEMAMASMSLVGPGNAGSNIKIKVNKDRGILDDLSYFSQDLEELSQNNNMCLKFYDFNGFKSSLSHRGGLKSISDPNGPPRGDEVTRGGRRNRNLQQPVPNLQLSSTTNQEGLKNNECLKTTESRSINNIAPCSPSSVFHPTKFRTVRPPDSQQMLKRPQQVKQSKQYFEQMCQKNEVNFLAQICGNPQAINQDKATSKGGDRIKESAGNKNRIVSSPYFGQKMQES